MDGTLTCFEYPAHGWDDVVVAVGIQATSALRGGIAYEQRRGESILTTHIFLAHTFRYSAPMMGAIIAPPASSEPAVDSDGVCRWYQAENRAMTRRNRDRRVASGIGSEVDGANALCLHIALFRIARL